MRKQTLATTLERGVEFWTNAFGGFNCVAVGKDDNGNVLYRKASDRNPNGSMPGYQAVYLKGYSLEIPYDEDAEKYAMN